MILTVLFLFCLFSERSVFAATVIGDNIITDGDIIINGQLQFANANDEFLVKTDPSGWASLVYFNDVLATSTTDHLPEGTLNLYYSDAAVDARISLQKGVAAGLATLDASSLVPVTQLPAGVANGLATLDASGKVPGTQLPALAITNVSVVADIAARDALTVETGDVAIVLDAGGGVGDSRTYIFDATTWQELLDPTNLYLSIGNNLSDLPSPALARGNLGLSNVENTALSSWPGSLNITTLGTITSAAGNVSLWTNDAGYLTSETDPVFSISSAAGIDAGDIADWHTAYGWGNHAAAGYLTAETDPSAVLNATFTANGDLLLGTGAGTYTNLAAGAANNGKVLTVLGGVPIWAAPGAAVETDPVAGAVNGIIKSDGAGAFSAVSDNSGNWNTAYGWGNHAVVGYLTAETDPSAVLKAIFTTNGDLLIGSGAGAYARLGVGSNGQCLISNGSAPVWGSCGSGILSSGTTADSTLRWNGSNWAENVNVLESAAGTLTIAAGQSYTGAGALTLSSGTGTAITITGNAASTWSTSTGNLTLQAGSGTVSLGTSTNLTANGALTVDSNTTSALNFGTGANGKIITIGNNTSGTRIILNGGALANGNGIKQNGRLTFSRATATADCGNANFSPTVTQILDAIITCTGSAVRTITLPTARGATGLIQGLPSAAVGDVFTIIFANGSGNRAITLAQTAGITFFGSTSVAASSSRQLYCRVTSVTAGSETATCY